MEMVAPLHVMLKLGTPARERLVCVQKPVEMERTWALSLVMMATPITEMGAALLVLLKTVTAAQEEVFPLLTPALLHVETILSLEVKYAMWGLEMTQMVAQTLALSFLDSTAQE